MSLSPSEDHGATDTSAGTTSPTRAACHCPPARITALLTGGMRCGYRWAKRVIVPQRGSRSSLRVEPTGRDGSDSVFVPHRGSQRCLHCAERGFLHLRVCVIVPAEDHRLP